MTLTIKNLMKPVLAAAVAIGTLAGAAGSASATDFTFSWSTPQGSFVIGPGNPNGHFIPRHAAPIQLAPHHVAPRHVAPRHAGPRHIAPVRHAIQPRQARQVLRQAGFRDISFLNERRDVYVFQALGNRGYRHVAVDKFSGDIIWRYGR